MRRTVPVSLEPIDIRTPISNADMWRFLGRRYGGTSNFVNTSLIGTDGPDGSLTTALNQHFAAGGYGMPPTGNGIALTSAPLGETFEEATIEYDVRFLSAGVPWGMGGKLPGLGGALKGRSVPSGGKPSPHGWSGRSMWRYVRGNPDLADWRGYIYDPMQKAGQVGQDRLTGKRFSKARWFHCAQSYRMNTVPTEGTGLPDGLHRMYFDGELCFENTAQVFRIYSEAAINRLVWDNFFGGNDPGWAPKADTDIQIANVSITAGS